jgi:hypothetical protein
VAAAIDVEEAVRNIVRLRRVQQQVDPAAGAELSEVVASLEESVGPTVTRARAARLLGISFNALGRWIEKGDVAEVTTPAGRREVPLAELVDLLGEVERHRGDRGRLALAEVIRERRQAAAAIDPDEILPARQGRSHRVAEVQSLAYHRLVARRLDDRLVDEARERLRRRREDGTIHERWASAWERALALPRDRLARLLREDTQRARDLRQTSPFAGALTEQERRRALRAAEERARA